MSDFISQFETFLQENPAAPLYRFVDAKGDTVDTLTREELDTKARRVSTLLLEHGLVYCLRSASRLR